MGSEMCIRDRPRLPYGAPSCGKSMFAMRSSRACHHTEPRPLGSTPMKVWTWAAVAAAVIAVISAAGVGIAAQQQLAHLEHGPAYEFSSATPLLEPATPEPIDNAQLQGAVERLANNPALADFHARISDAATGEVIFDRQAAAPLKPASTCLLYTSDAADE